MRGLGRWWIVAVVTGGLLFAGIVVFVRNPPREPERSVEVAVPSPEFRPDEGGDDADETDEREDTSDRDDGTTAPAIRVAQYMVREGDSLNLIASRVYDEAERLRGAHWLTIYAFNAESGAIDPAAVPIIIDGDRFLVLLEPGTLLGIPHYRDKFPATEPTLTRWGMVGAVVVETPDIGGTDGDEPGDTATGSSEATIHVRYVAPIRRGPEGTPRWATLEPATPEPDPGPQLLAEVAPVVTTPTPPPEAEPVAETAPAPPDTESRQEPGPDPVLSTMAEAEPRLDTGPEPQLLAEVAPVVTTPTPPPASPAEILLSQPAGDAFYRDMLGIEGSVSVGDRIDLSGEEGSLEQLIAYFEGQPGDSQIIYWDVTTGDFRTALPTESLRGHQTLVVEAETVEGVISRVRVPVFDGNSPPAMTLTAPDVEWGYGAFIEIAGHAVDTTADVGQPRGVEVIRYEILPSDYAIVQDPVEGEIFPDGDGCFSKVIPAAEIRGSQMVMVTARSVSGAEAELLLELPPADTAIPRIAATAAAGAVTIDWSRLPGDRTYAIWYHEVRAGDPEDDGRLWEDRDAQTIPNVSPPWTVTGLENGRRYRFQVVSGSDGREAWSETVENTPLTGEEFQLAATNDFDGILLQWNAVAESDRYALWRREDDEADYTRIASVPAWEYRDESVRYGVRYSYRVSLDVPGAIRSDVVYGQAAAVPQEAIVTIAASPGGDATAISVTGEYVLVGYENGVAVVDIWDAPRVVQRGSVTGLSHVRSLAGWSRYALVAEGADARDGRIRILDVDDPSRPRIVYTSPTTGVEELAVVPTVSSALVFAAGDRRGTAVYALEERPARLRLLTTIRPEMSYNLAVLTDIAEPERIYLATAGVERVVFQSVTASGSVVPRGSIAIAGVSDLDLIHDAAGAPLLLVTTDTDLVVVEPTGSDELRILSRTPIAGASAVRGASYADGSIFGYVGSLSGGGVTVLDLSDPEAPIQFAGSGGGHSVRSLELRRGITGQVTVATATEEGIAFFEAHTIGRSRSVATVVTPGYARRVRIAPSADGDVALITDTTGVAIQSAARAVRLRSADAQAELYFTVGTTVTGADLLQVEGRDFLLVADRENGLSAFDLSDSSAPVSHLSADMRPLDVIAERRTDEPRLAYVLDERWGLIMVDYAIPDQPVQRSATRVPAPRGFARVGSTVFIADAERGLVVIDAGDPDFPHELYTIDLPGALAVDVHAHDDGSMIAIVAQTDRYVVLTSQTREGAGEGAEPLERRGEYLSRYAESVQVDEQYAILGEGILGLNILDVSNPDRPRRISGSDLPFVTSAVRQDSFVFATDGLDFRIVEILIPPWLEYATSNR